MAFISIKDLSFSYPKSNHRAIDRVNLDIEQGDYLCICGSSGCGKTTLLRHLKTVLAPSGSCSGKVLYNDAPLSTLDNATQAANIGFVMQNPEAQIVSDKVLHELAFGLESLGVKGSIMRQRIAEVSTFLGITHLLSKDIFELSGGQKQLINLASVLAMQPSMLVLDEPTSQLDLVSTVEFLSMLRRINTEIGITIVIADHRLEEMYACANKVAVMDAGMIIAFGTPQEVAVQLNTIDHPMISALPTSTRVYFELLAKSKNNSQASSDYCPITVREGRAWLASKPYLHPPQVTSLEDEPNTPSVNYALRLKDLFFRYARNADDVLQGINLVVLQGSFHAIMGANGSGKSTLLKCICGVIKPYRGSIKILDNKPTCHSSANSQDLVVAMLPQNHQALFISQSVHQELQEMLSDQQLDRDAQNARIHKIAQQCHIESFLDANPLDLSEGEQQRVALAKVLLANPRILLLDEPTKGLDARFKQDLAALLISLKSAGTTIIMVSHDIEFCAQYADEVSLLFNGCISTTNTARNFFSQNSFYTTAANRMSKHIFFNAVTVDDVVKLCLANNSDLQHSNESEL